MQFRTKFRNFAVASGIVATLSCSTVFTPLWIDSINQGIAKLEAIDCKYGAVLFPLAA
jgi:hypothetical protein